MRSAEREKRWNTTNRRVGEWLETIGEDYSPPGIEGAELVSVLVRSPTRDRPECLLVLKARVGEDRFVAFIGGLTVNQAILTWRAKGLGRGLKWRKDTPWEGDAPGTG